MKISEFVVYLWMVPLMLQILFPLVVLCAWVVIKIPVSLFGLLRPAPPKSRTAYAG